VLSAEETTSKPSCNQGVCHNRGTITANINPTAKLKAKTIPNGKLIERQIKKVTKTDVAF
jgi:hypothetical protein